MATNIKEVRSTKDTIMWAIVWGLLATGIAANYYFSKQILAIRFVGWIVLLTVLALLGAQTVRGKQILVFMQEARIELRKVVWPTRQETVQTSMIVIGMVMVMALILWIIDSSLLWGIGFLTGTRG